MRARRTFSFDHLAEFGVAWDSICAKRDMEPQRDEVQFVRSSVVRHPQQAAGIVPGRSISFGKRCKHEPNITPVRRIARGLGESVQRWLGDVSLQSVSPDPSKTARSERMRSLPTGLREPPQQ